MTAVSDVAVGFTSVLLIVIGCAGYGRLLLGRCGELCCHRDQLGLSAVVGLCIYLALCGLLELFSVANRFAFATFLVVGATIWGLGQLGQHGQDRRARPLAPERSGAERAALLVIAALSFAFIINCCIWYFGNPDDLQGYLVFYKRIMQNGSEGSDPFAYRRFEYGLGGGIYIYALSFLTDTPAGIRVVDIGTGLVILAFLLKSHLEELRQTRWSAVIAGATLLVTVAFAPSVNMTPEIIGIAMFYGMIRAAFETRLREEWVVRALILGLFAFGVTCLKTTLMIPAACIILSTYLSFIKQVNFTKLLLEGFATTALIVLLMSPWMLVSYHAVDTPFFPILGIGKMSAIEVANVTDLGDFIKSGSRILIVMLLPLWTACSLVRQNKVTIADLSVLIPIICSVVFIMLQLKYTVAGYRYGFSSATAVFLFYLVVWLGNVRKSTEKMTVGLGLLAVYTNMTLYYLIQPNYGADTFTNGFLYRKAVGVDNRRVDAQLRFEDQEIAAMQDAVPRGATLLARIDAPYKLDFARNTVYVMDWPGMIGLLPNIPRTSSSTQWKAYLKASNIRYVAYSYGNEAGMSAASSRNQIARSQSDWQRTLAFNTLTVQTMLAALRTSEKVIYDDGTRYVVDLLP